MHFIGSVLTAIFITLLVFTVLSFGFALITVIVLVFMALTALVLLRGLVRRWLFLYHARLRTGGKPKRKKKVARKNMPDHNGDVIIDAEYKEIKRPWRDR